MPARPVGHGRAGLCRRRGSPPSVSWRMASACEPVIVPSPIIAPAAAVALPAVCACCAAVCPVLPGNGASLPQSRPGHQPACRDPAGQHPAQRTRPQCFAIRDWGSGWQWRSCPGCRPPPGTGAAGLIGASVLNSPRNSFGLLLAGSRSRRPRSRNCRHGRLWGCRRGRPASRVRRSPT